MFALIAQAALVFTTGLAYLGAFSRLTHGRYTPAFYGYQIDRAPDNESTKFVPVIDLVVGTLIALPRTRIYGAGLCALFYSIGLPMRAKSGKPMGKDVVLCLIAVGSFVDMLLQG